MLIIKPNIDYLRDMLRGVENETCDNCGSRDWSLRIDYNNKGDCGFELDFVWCWDCERESQISLFNEGGAE